MNDTESSQTNTTMVTQPSGDHKERASGPWNPELAHVSPRAITFHLTEPNWLDSTRLRRKYILLLKSHSIRRITHGLSDTQTIQIYTKWQSFRFSPSRVSWPFWEI